MYPPPASGLATTSMILGILAIPTCITAVPAIVTGHLAMSQIKQSNHQIGGAGQAKAGLILGYIVVALYAAIIVIAAAAGMAAPLLIRQHQKADQSEIMNNVRQIGLMLAEQEISDGKYPADLNDLKSEGGSKPVATLLQMPRSSSGDWLYYPNADSSAPSALLLISPEIGAKEVVLRVDGSVKLEKAEEAERLANGSSSPPQRLPAPRK